MSNNKFIQICVIGEIEGNVNADEVVGQRVTIKKFITREGIYPFVSSRAIKKGIKAALEMRGYEIDPFHSQYGTQKEETRGDSGDFVRYVDQDIFGYMIPGKSPKKRKAPVEISYFVSLFPIPITVEFACRFPKGRKPQPFEIEQARFLGKFYANIYNYIGIIHQEEIKKDILENIGGKLKEARIRKEENGRVIEKSYGRYYEDEKREQKLRDLLEILLTGNFKLPRSTNQLNQGFYKYVVICFTKSLKPLPSFVTIKYQKERQYEVVKKEENGKVIEKIIERSDEGYTLDWEKIKEFEGMLENGEKIFVIDFVGNLKEVKEGNDGGGEKKEKPKTKVIRPSNIKEEIIDKLKDLIDLNDFEYYLRYYGGWSGSGEDSQ